ncbi:hypothetical protein PoMZ_04197, partial [Pyricularia oryzae]
MQKSYTQMKVGDKRHATFLLKLRWYEAETEEARTHGRWTVSRAIKVELIVARTVRIGDGSPAQNQRDQIKTKPDQEVHTKHRGQGRGFADFDIKGFKPRCLSW